MNTFQLPSVLVEAMKNLERTQKFANHAFAKNQSILASMQQASEVMEKFVPIFKQHERTMQGSNLLRALDLSSKIAEKFRPIFEQQEVFLNANGLLEAFQRTQKIIDTLYPLTNENGFFMEDTDIPNEISIPIENINGILENIQNINDEEALLFLNRSIAPAINNLLRSLFSIALSKEMKYMIAGFILSLIVTHLYYLEAQKSAAQDKIERKEEYKNIITTINAHTDSAINAQKQLVDSVQLINALLAEQYISITNCNVYSSSHSQKVIYELKKGCIIYVKNSERKKLHIVYISDGGQVDGWIYKRNAEKRDNQRRKPNKKYSINKK